MDFLTGRIDFNNNSFDTMKAYILAFINEQNKGRKDKLIKHYIFAYENKAKSSGLKVKDHFHFYLKLDAAYVDIDNIRKRFRQWWTNKGFTKTLCSFASRKLSEDYTEEKGLNYIMKQQEPDTIPHQLITSYTSVIINELCLKSQQYQQSLTNNKFESWNDHKQEIIKNIKDYLEVNKLKFITRQQINKYIFTYVQDWNKNTIKPDHNIVLPPSQKLIPLINQIEFDLFPPEVSLKLREYDFGAFLHNRQLDEIYKESVNIEPTKKEKPLIKKSISQLIYESDSD